MMLQNSQHTKMMEAVDITEDRNVFAAEEDAVLNVEEIGEVAVAAEVPVISNITVGLMECVNNQALTTGP